MFIIFSIRVFVMGCIARLGFEDSSSSCRVFSFFNIEFPLHATDVSMIGHLATPVHDENRLTMCCPKLCEQQKQRLLWRVKG